MDAVGDKADKKRGDKGDAGLRGRVVLQACPDLAGGGGLERGCVEIACGVSRASAVSLVCAATVGQYHERLRQAGVKFIPTDLSRARYGLDFWRHVAALREIIREHDVDIVHARSRYPAWVAWAATRGASARFVATWHGRHVARRFSPRGLYNKALTRADHLIAVSRWVECEILRQAGGRASALRSRISVIERGADADVFDPVQIMPRAQALRVSLLQEAGMSRDARIILAPGRYTPWKGQLAFMRTLARLDKMPDRVKRDDGCEWVCVFVGSAPKPRYMARLACAAKRFGIERRVLFKGRTDDMPAWCGASDVIALPNIAPEPFGRVAVEAQMAGKPVIAYALGALAETLEAPSVLIKPDDCTGFAEALARMLGHPPTLAERAGLRAGMIARFDVGGMLSRTLALYGKLLKSRPDIASR